MTDSVTPETAAEPGGAEGDEDEEDAALGEVWERKRKERDERDADDSATRTGGKKPSEDVAGKKTGGDGEAKGEGGDKEPAKKEKPEKQGEKGDSDASGKDKSDDSKDQSKSVDDKKDGENSDKPKADKDYSKPPQNIHKALKDSWDKLPPEVQKEMTEHHAETQARDRDFGRKAKQVERVAEEVKPVADLIKALREANPNLKDVDNDGLAAGIGALVKLSADLDAEPEKTLLQMAGKLPGFLGELKKLLTEMPDERIAEFEAKLAGNEEGARMARLEAENRALREGAEKNHSEGLTDTEERDRLRDELKGHLSDFGSTAPHWGVLEAETKKHLPAVVDENPRDTSWPDLILQAYARAHLQYFPGQDLPKFAGLSGDEGKARSAEAANELSVNPKPGDSPGDQSEDDAMAAIWEKHKGRNR